MKHFFDLDNTLVYTDLANSRAYNAALVREGLEPIRTAVRITRETVARAYPEMEETRLARIIANKQRLFSADDTKVDADLARYAMDIGKRDCFLWSSADRARAFAVLDCHGLRGLFSEIYFSEKKDVVRELETLVGRSAFAMRDIIVYEDTDAYIEALRAHGIKVEDVKRWRPGKSA